VASALAIAYLNGSFVPIDDARVSPLDRGFLFGDAVYEVIPVFGKRPFLLDAHLQRLRRSLKELQITEPCSTEQWKSIISGLIEKNDNDDLTVYLQVTRGADSGRDHMFPDGVQPTVFGMASKLVSRDFTAGVSAIVRADNRWNRCDIKATALLANVLSHQQACEEGAADAILVWGGEVTEGSSSSVIIVENGSLIRRPNGQEVLPGTTTDHVVALAQKAGISCHQEPISESRLRDADEIWLTSATKGIAPVVRLDDQLVGTGVPGPVWQKVIELYEASKRE
jgi:D-alanine transaminase